MISEVWPVGIPLHARDGSVRAVTLVDADDYERVSKYRWYLSKPGYVRADTGSRPNRRRFALHRLLLGLESGDKREGDHINRDPLDNRRCNLQIVDRQANCENVRGHSRGSLRPSKHRGVSWAKARNKWQAYATHDYKRYPLGYHENEEDAAEAARAFRAAHMANAQD